MPMNWKDCGYLSLTKDGKKITVMLKHERYLANKEELKAVLDGEQKCTLDFPAYERNK